MKAITWINEMNKYNLGLDYFTLVCIRLLLKFKGI